MVTRDRLADLTARMAQTNSPTRRSHRRQGRITSRSSATDGKTHGDTAHLNNPEEDDSDDEDEVDYPVRYEDYWQNATDNEENSDEENVITRRPRLMSEATWLQVEKFLSVAAQLHQEIHLLESYMEDVKLKHSQLLVSPHEDKKAKGELDSVMEAFNQLSRKVRKTVKEMEREFEKVKLQRATGPGQNNKQLQPGVADKSRADDRIRENQLSALNRRLLKVLRAYNEEQVRYRECCTKRIKSYIDLTGEPIKDDELDEIIESGNLYRRVGGVFMEEGKAKKMLEDIEARHADIVRLEASVRELHQMFQDMALLVEEQGEKIDSIEFNVQLAMDYTEKAKRQIKQAVAHRDRYRRKKFIFCTICIVFVIILLIIIISSICSQAGCGRGGGGGGGGGGSSDNGITAQSVPYDSVTTPVIRSRPSPHGNGLIRTDNGGVGQ